MNVCCQCLSGAKIKLSGMHESCCPFGMLYQHTLRKWCLQIAQILSRSLRSSQSAASLKILSAILELLFELAELSEDSLIVASGVSFSSAGQ